MSTAYGIFDSHAHYDDERFAEDRREVLAGMPEKGVALIMNAACNLQSAQAGIALAEEFPHVYCSAGVHPHDAQGTPDTMEQQLRVLAAHPKVKAIGELGLDYHYDFSPREQQLDVFERQLAVAKELDLPVIIHDREAHAPTLELLRKYRPQGVVHCYSGSAEMAKQLLDLGLYIGFTGVVTFKNARRALEAARVVPIDRLLIETDCPYMAPEPYRGKRCDSTMLPRTAAALAAAKELPVETVIEKSFYNACALYRI